MKKEEYLEYGKKYLKIKTTIGQWRFRNYVAKKFPKAKAKVFLQWIDTVNMSESHRNTKMSNEQYLKRLSAFLSKK